MEALRRIEDIYRPCSVRLEDWDEAERKLEREEITGQSLRCLACGIPFCHGLGCPLGNEIPDINKAVSENNWVLAWNILSATSCFPEFTSRVCPALCENACVKNIESDPVMVRQLEKAVVETAFERGYVKPPFPELDTGKMIAVIGSGPSGLAAAHYLRKRGHSVSVFEKNLRPGGLLRYGIPDFKLDKRVIDRRIELMEEAGVKFRCRTEIGRDVSAGYLRRTFDAVLMAVGTPVARDLKIPGRELKNIWFALDYLSSRNRFTSGESVEQSIDARGKRVVIIGGGDTGSDCLGTALRQKAESVIQLDILPRPPEKRHFGTPWPEWPYELKTSSSHKEGGSRIWSVITKSFSGENGVLREIEIADAKWEMSAEGKPLSFREVPGTSRLIKADMALIAMGFAGVPEGGAAGELNLEISPRGELGSSPENMVFSCGDAKTGQSLVVKAIRSGRDAAEDICRKLGRESVTI